jgi:hypothetical protein
LVLFNKNNHRRSSRAKKNKDNTAPALAKLVFWGGEATATTKPRPVKTGK